MPAPPAKLVNLVLGPELMGLVISYFLFGALFVQLFYYMSYFSTDRMIIRVTVAVVFVSEVLLIVVTSRISYAMLCLGWGDPRALVELGWIDHCIPLLSAIVSGWAQLFYAWRIYVLGRKTRLWTTFTLLIIPVSLTSTIATLFCAFSGMFTDTSIKDLERLQTPVVIWLVSSAVCDFLNAVGMVCVMAASIERVRDTGNTATERRLNLVIRYAVESGVLTVTGAILKLLFFVVFPASRFFPMMGFINSKLYSNALMASLNSRPGARPDSSTMRSSEEGKNLSNNDIKWPVVFPSSGKIGQVEDFFERVQKPTEKRIEVFKSTTYF